MEKNFFTTIERPALAEYKDRGSRFLAYAFPIQTADDFKKRYKEVKDEHPKAAHHCYAYRIGTEGTNFRTNDDGEPSGTAGKPILNQLDSKGITDTAVIVVRYFGGTLLGAPGLVNAYKTATSLVLQLTPIIQRPVLVEYEIEFDYTVLNEIMQIVKRFHCVILKKDLQLFCSMVVGVPKAEEEQCLQQLKEYHTVLVKKKAAKA
ncbi:MAG: YigZ family protein [Flavisolibacter sp.]|nr:YigZ family protein [Flavisolibacter sp.]